jgi:hypothetical protein
MTSHDDDPASSYFEVVRGPDGSPVRLTPVSGRVEYDGTGYIVREEP